MRGDHAHTRTAIRARLAGGPRRATSATGSTGASTAPSPRSRSSRASSGRQLSPRIILVLGAANLVADGFSMAAGNYLATRAEHEERRFAEAVERRHIATVPEGEREEVREIFRQRGLSGDLLEQRHRGGHGRWTRSLDPDDAAGRVRAAGGDPRAVAGGRDATFSAFFLCGLVPLVPFVLAVPRAPWVAAGATFMVFAAIGALKSRWSVASWWRSALGDAGRRRRGRGRRVRDRRRAPGTRGLGGAPPSIPVRLRATAPVP